MRTLNRIVGGSSAIVAALVINVSTIQAQNLLVNPGFEDPLLPAPGVNQGWAAFGTAARTGPPILPLPPVAHSGDYSLLAQNAPGNNWNPVGVEQIVDGTILGFPYGGVNPGIQYTFDCWYMTDTGVTYANPVGLEIGFLDSAMANIGTTGGFNFNIPSNNTWYQGSVTATAPAGSVYIVVYAMFMDNAQTTTEHVYFDDASLSVVPEPSSLALISMGLGLPLCFVRRRHVSLLHTHRLR
jgi:hypothetical protein